jgi:inorganic pyrophosphatase
LPSRTALNQKSTSAQAEPMAGGFCMSVSNSLQESVKFEIETYRPPKDIRTLRETHVAFSGSLRQHPYDPAKVIMVVDPMSGNSFYYEFARVDISFAEKLPNLVNLEDEIIPVMRIWVKKKRIAVRCTPFVVEDVRKAL